MLSFGEKIAKISPADPELICLQEIIKDEEEETRKAWQSLAYSSLGAVMSPPSEY